MVVILVTSMILLAVQHAAAFKEEDFKVRAALLKN